MKTFDFPKIFFFFLLLKVTINLYPKPNIHFEATQRENKNNKQKTKLYMNK